MRKVFWDNPYQTCLTTRVTAVDANQVLLDATIAFSFSGGQESDKAYINDLPITHSKMVGNLIYYTLPDGHALQVGDSVTMTIDWPRRYALMKLHFAAELILELVSDQLKAVKIGAHISEHKARIDFLYSQNISHCFDAILQKYKEIIGNNHTIKTDFSDVEQQRRYWEIEGLAQVPCGGTHVKSTAEVGLVTLKRVNVGGGKERIDIKLVR